MSCVERRRWLANVALIATMTFVFGCAVNPAPRSPAPRIVGEAHAHAYVVGVPDLLELTGCQQPDLSGPLLVRRDGEILVKSLGDVQSEGLTSENLAEKIRQGLSAFVTNPNCRHRGRRLPKASSTTS